uniref:Dilute domain-containing protein n=1 Tax=Kalanchoe fedtschenkoi TaxID=63787 RepID=A0A7N0SWQ3_KALFE
MHSDSKAWQMVIRKGKLEEISREDNSRFLEKQVEDNESESGSSKDSDSSLGDSVVTAEQKAMNRISSKRGDDIAGRSSRMLAAKDGSVKASKSGAEQKTVLSALRSNKNASIGSTKGYSGKDVEKKNAPKISSESPQGIKERLIDDVKGNSQRDQVSDGTQSVESAEEDSEHVAAAEFEGNEDSDSLIKEMELKIEILEEELREVAALEISIYSVIPEHGCSAHKVHTPARRLSRLYIHACKHWNRDRRATIAKNTVSGLILVSKSCGNDVPRLTFWLSNIVVLREIICETFGASSSSSPGKKFSETNQKGSSDGKPMKKAISVPLQTEWLETQTFTSTLERVESWIFSRIVESVWWQTLASNMQSSPKDDDECNARVSGPFSGDQQQEQFSMSLWQKAFEEAFQRLCPVRSGGHECGCLPVLARMVLDECVARLDVAMFNAILRESMHEIPTDPISDPIVDPKVLPIPAGELSFGSGAQLKNSIGHWSRWLTDMCGMDLETSSDGQQQTSKDGRRSDSAESFSFSLLSALSDLLMLPKDMLMDRSVRKEVCPSINLSLIKRILCNFTPDEFCPDAVPGMVLEAINAESIVERRLSGDSSSGFPYKAGPVTYSPPSTVCVAEKVAEVGARSQLMRNASLVQKKGYTSDDELQELRSPLGSIIGKQRISPAQVGKQNRYDIRNESHGAGDCGNSTRYELLGEVWHA